MSSVKDVGVENEKKAIEVEDNLRLDEIARGYKVLVFGKDHFLARRFKIDSIRIYDKSVLSVSRYGDEMFTRTRNRLIRDEDVLTYVEQMRYLESRGLWDESKEAELVDLRTKVIELNQDKDDYLSTVVASQNDKLSKKAKERLDKTIKKYQEIFEKYSGLVAINYEFFRDTLEMQAEIAQMKGWIVSTVAFN